jgi:multidrug efflux system membrane fusion protein
VRRRLAAIAGAVVVSTASLGAGVLIGRASSAVEPEASAAVLPTVAVERRTLTASTPVDGTLGYRGAYRIANALVPDGNGVLTGLAAIGDTVEPGDTLYTLDASVPVVLLEGSLPAWRDLTPSASDGADVEQLEAALSELGFGSDALDVDQHWDAETTAAVKRWQASIGLEETGSIPFGQVVFAPEALRITAQAASLGMIVQPGATVLEATSTDPIVRVALDTALQSQVSAGDPVTVTLPDGRTVDGHVSEIATVATQPSGGGSEGGQGGDASPSIAIEVSLDDPAAVGRLDEAPVSVNITTATARDVLVVPVAALVLTQDGSYAVQVADAGRLRYVTVELGLFAGGQVEVSGPELAEGQRVVVAR